MKKIIAFCIIFLFAFTKTQAQEHEFHDRITSDIWETIAKVKHRVVDDYEYYPIFNAEVRALNEKTVSLKGYMVPIKEGFQHTSFLLSVLPVSQCFFCGKNGIPMMIEVQLKKPVAYSEKVITVKGMIKLRQVNAAYSCPIVLSGANIIE
jgi:hypothetical protein